MLKIIAKSEGHPSVEQIYEQMKADFSTTSLATIYKTITLLKYMHEVLELDFVSVGSRYDGNKPYPHPHVICTECSQIMDREAEFTVMDEVCQEMAEQTGYQITNHQLNFFGLCPDCQKKG
jgi:Fur family transcriptional regulator, peroxide stress response regulator